MIEKIQDINKVCINVGLTFFVSYSVLQSTAVSLKLSNDIIISVLFLLLTLQIALQMQMANIKIFARDHGKSLLKYVRPLDYVVFAFLLINTIWIFLVPKVNGFAVSDAIREAGMLALFVLYFPLAILIRMKQINVQFLVKVFYWSIFVLACWHIIMWIGETIHVGFFQQFLNFMGSLHIFKTGEIISGWGIVRISISNSILLGIGLIITFAHIGNLRLIDIVCTVVFMTSIMCTFLRSLWLGVFCGLVLFFFYFVYLMLRKRYIESRGMLFIVLTMTLTIIVLNFTAFQSSISNRMQNIFIHSSYSSTIYSNKNSSIASARGNSGNSLSSSTQPTQDKTRVESRFDKDKDTEGALVSNNIKIEQMKKLIQEWLKKPLTGYGYGSYIRNYLRSKTATYAYEMTTFSLLMKTGIIGFSTWILLVISVLIHAYKTLKNKKYALFVWLASAISFIVSIQTNPLLFMANALSFIIYLILFTVNNEDVVEGGTK